MRAYRTDEYLKNLEGNIFHTSSEEFKKLDGKKVKKVIRELTDQDYDRELIDTSDVNENGNPRYEINCMYEVKIGKKIIAVYEDEINPEYAGDFVEEERKE